MRIKEGQTVRLVIEGEVHKRSGALCIGDPSIAAIGHHDGTPFNWIDQKEVTLTILSEPRIDEPEGLGAVVEASSEEYPDSRKIYVRRPEMSLMDFNNWTSSVGSSTWAKLIDPIELKEGYVG